MYMTKARWRGAMLLMFSCVVYESIHDCKGVLLHLLVCSVDGLSSSASLEQWKWECNEGRLATQYSDFPRILVKSRSFIVSIVFFHLPLLLFVIYLLLQIRLIRMEHFWNCPKFAVGIVTIDLGSLRCCVSRIKLFQSDWIVTSTCTVPYSKWSIRFDCSWPLYYRKCNGWEEDSDELGAGISW